MTTLTMKPRRLARVRDALEAALDDDEPMSESEFRAVGQLLEAMETEAAHGNTVLFRMELERLQ